MISSTKQLFRYSISYQVYARNIMYRQFIYIACPDASVYLQRTKQREIKSESRKAGNLSKLFHMGTNYLVFPSVSSHDNEETCYIKTSIKSYHVYRELSSIPSVSASHAVQFESFSSTCSSFIKGVHLNCKNEEQNESLTNKIHGLISQDPELTAFEMVQSTNSCFSLKKLAKHGSLLEEESIYLSIFDRSLVHSADALPESSVASPIFTTPGAMPVFHQYNTAKDILTQLLDTSEVKELLDIADKHVTSLCNAETQLKFPFVVIEGMDATGKTTLTEAIERKLGAVKYFTPPPQISHLRPHFDRYPEIVRRAYYSLGNYIVAMDILRECETRPVIMDRFWHSTAAYGIANETSMSDLPGAGHPVYDWPGDLVRPTLVLFLTVQEEVRRRRLSDRGVLATFEETALDKDGLFRKRLCNAYRLMGNPALVEIDASGTVEEVRNMAIELLKQHGICLQTDM